VVWSSERAEGGPGCRSEVTRRSRFCGRCPFLFMRVHLHGVLRNFKNSLIRNGFRSRSELSPVSASYSSVSGRRAAYSSQVAT